MTHDQTDTVQSDIAYLKSLAEQGRDAPVLVGPVLVAAGTIFGAATAVQWGIAAGLIDLHGWAVLGVWVAAALAFTVALIMIIRRIGAQVGSGSVRNRTIGAAWSACGYSIFAMWMALMAYGIGTGQWSAMALMPSVVMIAYGSAWLIAGLVVERRWMVLTGMTSYVGGVGLAWFANTSLIYGIYLLMLLLVAVLPGLNLMSQQKAAMRNV